VTEAYSIPLIRLFDNLIVSVQVALSDEIVERLMTQITDAIERTNVSGLILDFSGADVMDSHITRRVHDIAVTARLMGVDTVVCGLRASIVITFTEMGLSLTGVTTALNLERALEHLVLKSFLKRGPLSRATADDGSGDAGERPGERPGQRQGAEGYDAPRR
jgi:rsbT antagonist protein RsbS